MHTNRNTTVALAALLILASTAIAQTEGGPELVVPSKIIDVGTVAQGVTVDADFDLVNEGNAPLDRSPNRSSS